MIILGSPNHLDVQQRILLHLPVKDIIRASTINKNVLRVIHESPSIQRLIYILYHAIDLDSYIWPDSLSEVVERQQRRLTFRPVKAYSFDIPQEQIWISLERPNVIVTQGAINSAREDENAVYSLEGRMVDRERGSGSLPVRCEWIADGKIYEFAGARTRDGRFADLTISARVVDPHHSSRSILRFRADGETLWPNVKHKARGPTRWPYKIQLGPNNLLLFIFEGDNLSGLNTLVMDRRTGEVKEVFNPYPRQLMDELVSVGPNTMVHLSIPCYQNDIDILDLGTDAKECTEVVATGQDSGNTIPRTNQSRITIKHEIWKALLFDDRRRNGHAVFNSPHGIIHAVFLSHCWENSMGEMVTLTISPSLYTGIHRWTTDGDICLKDVPEDSFSVQRFHDAFKSDLCPDPPLDDTSFSFAGRFISIAKLVRIEETEAELWIRVLDPAPVTVDEPDIYYRGARNLTAPKHFNKHTTCPLRSEKLSIAAGTPYSRITKGSPKLSESFWSFKLDNFPSKSEFDLRIAKFTGNEETILFAIKSRSLTDADVRSTANSDSDDGLFQLTKSFGTRIWVWDFVERPE